MVDNPVSARVNESKLKIKDSRIFLLNVGL